MQLLQNPSTKFVIYFIGLSVLFNLGITFFEGLEGIGGTFDSAYYRAHIHLIENYRQFLLWCNQAFYALWHVPTNRFGEVVQIVGGYMGIRLNNGCLGLGVLSIWIAFVLSYPLPRNKRIAAFFFGSILLILINIARLLILLYIYSHNIGANYPWIDQHFVFNVVSYGFILGMGYLLVRE